ncbi:D-proline reductase subunit gamma [Anaeromyxobacter sp. PSR-1]|nr:D-proline reductase subunit gamma [Anaeromyxobacter sp. PSR-1]
MADEAAPRPLELSRYCVPFTPFAGRLEEATICLVSTAAVRLASDRPFDTGGDTTWRAIPGDAEAKDLRYDDTHYDHACVDADLNCVFPIDRVRELARDGRVGGLTARHFSLGYSQALRELRERTIPALVREIDRERPGAVLLTGG